ncbi:PPR domain-containing protein/PPR_2 domain-containing protein/PPR_3 domain-containing protein/DYW_deaminase domain-containing protein [Cephalotus follicularis]|uniref:PPR domain-containing protein/PPR_2 domain-containing protein/PPR_3 domain-containing protein/DYW_deaminase domain-containing protein n=1 Tax=Cephalotus follicularis TaxID=3775 RepID=A0A1Q3BDX0_CEPFO|nr:PPR domain-containing protein/PPR_2 domain-containing protein/PPR_3 domain-containing protein/DYW_deaminase domain-containing protein [Cephalotus follicularis]
MISHSLPSPSKLPPPFLKPSTPSSQKPPSSSPPSIITYEPLKDRMIRHLEVGHLHKAISTLDLMTQRGIHPDLITYSLLLKACIRLRNYQLGRLVHDNLTHSKLELDSIIYNSLISLYSKCGDTSKAKIIFDNMGSKRDLVSWSAMISCFATSNMEFEAIVMFLDMLDHGFYPNEYCFTAVIRACSNAENVSFGMIVFGFLIKCGYFESDVCVGCSLIDMFAKGSGDLESARKVFNKMPERNVVTWTLMITRCAHLGCPRDAIGLFLDMILSGYVPDKFTLSGVVSACAELGLLSLGQQLHSWVIRLGLALDVCIGCCLVDMYAKCVADGSVDNSWKVFDRMPDHNVMLWTALITAYVQSGRHDREAIELFCKMIQGPVAPNQFTFSSILKACGNLSASRMGEQVYTHALKMGLASVNCVGNSLISMYARCGSVENARKAFDVLFEKNLVSYNTIVDAYTKNLNSEEAFELFHEIENAGIGASAFTFASLLSGASSIGAIGKGEQIHARVLKSGFDSNLQNCNALISMYSKCGNIEAAFQVFDELGDRNVISWTSMITGFAKHGFAKRALGLFHEMLEERIRPNEITYVAVLSACSHVGLISEGWQHFESMYTEHGIAPRTEHYACMVDLLGRSGSLMEAIEFINSMPIRADALVWRTFLSACRVHGNTELGKHAAKMVLKQVQHDPAAYILLSNLYASAGQWEDVAEIRKKMKKNNVMKEAGCSWIEVKNEVHKFYVGDTSHPRAHEIFYELNILASKIKELGYVPNTDLVLHEVEEEQKEQYLLQHSEKIAVAFGLVAAAKSKPIRILKNLRVCGDCHNAIKYISMATGREIVVRDSNRFHHFRDGMCSCNDYW